MTDFLWRLRNSAKRLARSLLRRAGRHRYEYSVRPTDTTAPAAVVRMVGTDIDVLDVGAGTGSIAQVLTERNRCRVTAIEIDEDAIRSLEGRCERVIRVDLDSPAWADALGRAAFDAVVMADVLEHLRDPWTVLTRAAGLLGPDGHLVVSLPHVGHGALLAAILEGDFGYREDGLLDRTHIRFFGLRNMQKMIERAGLGIVEAALIVREPERTELARHWRRLDAGMKRMLEGRSHANVYQVVLTAERSVPGLDLLALPVPSPPP